MVHQRIHVASDVDLSAAQRARLKGVTPLLNWDEIRRQPDEAVRTVDSDVEILIAATLPVRVETFPRLRWLQLPFAGVDHLDLGAWPKHITLTTAVGVFSVPVAQYVLGAMLRACERMGERDNLQARREWPVKTVDRMPYVAQLLRGRVVVILGYGSIGREVARLAHAHGADIVAIKRSPEMRADHRDSFRVPGTGDPDGSLPARVIGIDDLPACLGEAAFLVITAPLTSASRAVVGREALNAMSRDAWVVNVSRGALLDEAALVDVLRAQNIGGAVLDVFVDEPLPASSPLWTLPNVVITPHIAGAGERHDFLIELVVENLRRYLAAEPLLNRVALDGAVDPPGRG